MRIESAADGQFEATLRRFLADEAERTVAASPPVEVIVRRLDVDAREAPTEGGLLGMLGAIPLPVQYLVVLVLALTTLILGFGVVGIHLPQPSPTPSASATPLATAQALDLTADVDTLLADWSSGNGADLASHLTGKANAFFVIDSGDITEEYHGAAAVGAAVTARRTHGFTLSRTGAVIPLGALAAVPVRWSSSDTYGSGDGVLMLELAWEHRVLAQFLVGVTTDHPAVSVGGARQDVVRRVNDMLHALMINQVSADDVARAFSTDAEWRGAGDNTGFGWWGFGPAQVGLPTITAAIMDQRGIAITPSGSAVQQGPLVIYPASFSTPYGSGTGFWLFRVGNDGLIEDYWDFDAWQ